MEHLSHKVSALSAWKQALLREITRYRNLMGKGKLVAAAEARLEAALHLLRSDQITLALIGEFSRGKTELINSLLFSPQHQRLLPSQTGRTTLCPTELYFEQEQQHPSIQLLPVETRLSGKSLAVLKRKRKYWKHIPLNDTAPEALAKAFAEVASTKAMPKADAERLGLCTEKLEPAEQPGYLLAPRWQHALINFDHPLLRMGLRIIDTPGLNALDSEPELTLSILPETQAILFVLGLDTGVSATDLAVWQNDLHGERGYRTLCFAILNKIDLLWDDPQGEAFVEQSIARMCQKTAEQLGIAIGDVLPLSAKQGLLARIRGNKRLLKRSQLLELEKLLGERLVRQKEQLLGQTAIKQVLELVQGSYQVLEERLNELRGQQDLLNNKQQDNSELLARFASKTKTEHESYRKRLVQLKNSHNLLKEQTAKLIANNPQARLKGQLVQLKQEVKKSLTALGVRKSSDAFFALLNSNLERFSDEVNSVNQTVAGIYRQHNKESEEQKKVVAPLFDLASYQEELSRLSSSGHQFSLYPWALFNVQAVLKERFLMALEEKVIELFQRLHENTTAWSNSALIPLMQRFLEHKKLLENQMSELKTLTQDNYEAHKQGGELQQHIGSMTEQLQELGEIIEALQQPLSS